MCESEREMESTFKMKLAKIIEKSSSLRRISLSPPTVLFLLLFLDDPMICQIQIKNSFFFLTYCFACMRTNNDCLFAVHFMLLLCILTFSVGFVCGKSIYTKKNFFRMQWMDVWKLDDIVEVCISKMYFSE